MKIVVVSHQLPPNYRSGAELYAWQQCRWLQNQGHEVRAVAVEDIEARLPHLEARPEVYQGVPVTRLHFDRLNYPNPLEVSHNNPEVEAWFKTYLDEFEPELLLVNACYLLGVGILTAARQAGIPVVLTLHDFWFLCQRLTLMRPDGTLCDGQVTPADCALCLAKDRRRYLLADKLSGGLAGRALVAGATAGWQPFQQLLGGPRKLETLANRRRVLLEALGQVERIIAPSQYLKQVFVENNFPADKIHYCRYGLDTARLVSLEQERSRRDRLSGAGEGHRPLRVGYLGQVLPHKGVDVLVEAFGLVKSRSADQAGISLTVHGEMGRNPAYDAKLHRLAAGDSRIKFAGAYNAAQLPEILLPLDLVVVPSIWLENSPIVIMEAQSAGIPVIATDLGGMAEMVRHGENGLLFARKDARDLAKQLQRLLDEPGLLARLRAGTVPVKSLDQEFAELVPLYSQVVAEAALKRAGQLR
ncbi:MAG: glycosyl transferase group 1 [Chloroflexi bacterium]|nr:glycosyl transferase group 1 [Chloroflexota bacterium]